MLPDVVTYGNLTTVGAPRDGHLGSVESAGGGRLFCVPFSSVPFEFCIVSNHERYYFTYFGYCFF